MVGFSTAASKARACLVDLADRFFGCRHGKTTMPMTARPDDTASGSPATHPGTYIVCLECGRRLAYDLNGAGVGKGRFGLLGRRRATKGEQASDRAARR